MFFWWALIDLRTRQRVTLERFHWVAFWLLFADSLRHRAAETPLSPCNIPMPAMEEESESTYPAPVSYAQERENLSTFFLIFQCPRHPTVPRWRSLILHIPITGLFVQSGWLWVFLRYYFIRILWTERSGDPSFLAFSCLFSFQLKN